MSKRISNALLVFLLAFIFLAPGQIMAMSNAPIYHVIEIGNDGQGAVRNVEIEYGDALIPSGTAHRDLPPDHMVTVGESRMMAVPEVVVIHWTSEDGRPHVVTTKMRDLISDTVRFHGVQFFFNDDYVDIYQQNRPRDWPRDLDLKRAKIFSSKP